MLPPGASTVELTLEPAGAATVLRLRHAGLPEETFEFHGDGWDESLSALAGMAAVPNSTMQR